MESRCKAVSTRRVFFATAFGCVGNASVRGSSAGKAKRRTAVSHRRPDPAHGPQFPNSVEKITEASQLCQRLSTARNITVGRDLRAAALSGILSPEMGRLVAPARFYDSVQASQSAFIRIDNRRRSFHHDRSETGIMRVAAVRRSDNDGV